MCHICSLSLAHSHSAQSYIDSTKMVVMLRSLCKYVFVLMLWVNHSIFLECCEDLLATKNVGNLARNNWIVLRLMAPNYLMPRLASPSQGSVDNFGLSCFKMHANIGRLSRGGVATKFSYKHLYVDSGVIYWFTSFISQNCLPIAKSGFT